MTPNLGQGGCVALEVSYCSSHLLPSELRRHLRFAEQSIAMHDLLPDHTHENWIHLFFCCTEQAPENITVLSTPLKGDASYGSMQQAKTLSAT